jgi:hypothetical protein
MILEVDSSRGEIGDWWGRRYSIGNQKLQWSLGLKTVVDASSTVEDDKSRWHTLKPW